MGIQSMSNKWDKSKEMVNFIVHILKTFLSKITRIKQSKIGANFLGSGNSQQSDPEGVGGSSNLSTTFAVEFQADSD